MSGGVESLVLDAVVPLVRGGGGPGRRRPWVRARDHPLSLIAPGVLVGLGGEAVEVAAEVRLDLTAVREGDLTSWSPSSLPCRGRRRRGRWRRRWPWSGRPGDRLVVVVPPVAAAMPVPRWRRCRLPRRWPGLSVVAWGVPHWCASIVPGPWWQAAPEPHLKAPRRRCRPIATEPNSCGGEPEREALVNLVQLTPQGWPRWARRRCGSTSTPARRPRPSSPVRRRPGGPA